MNGGDSGVFQWLIGTVGAAFAAVVGWAWKHTHRRIETMDEDKVSRREFVNHEVHVREEFARLGREQDTQRAHIAKIFDKLEDVRNDSHQQHVELLNAIANIPRR